LNYVITDFLKLFSFKVLSNSPSFSTRPLIFQVAYLYHQMFYSVQMRKVIWGKSSGCLSRGVTGNERCVIVICGWIRKLRNILKGNCGRMLKYRMGC